SWRRSRARVTSCTRSTCSRGRFSYEVCARRCRKRCRMAESNAQPALAESPDPEIKSFFDTLRGALFASIPALSVLVFIVVAVKVFRASRMETTTTVAIVSTADVVALLKGVILTLLPGFLAALTAAAIWWWAGVIPEHAEGADPRRAAT